jgi:MOSC domain-containing protein YiiM
MNEYPVFLHHIFVSPGHNYFGRPKHGPGAHATHDLAEVEAHAGQGLAGDRFFGVAAHYDAQVTFVAWEVFHALQAEWGRDDWSPAAMRRNIVLAGVPLNQLIGQPFTLDFDGHTVEFLGAAHCAPCAWMDAMLALGAQKFLRGRGGLRARIVSSGRILRGAGLLRTPVDLNTAAVLAPIARMPLPGAKSST